MYNVPAAQAVEHNLRALVEHVHRQNATPARMLDENGKKARGKPGHEGGILQIKAAKAPPQRTNDEHEEHHIIAEEGC